MNECHKKSLDWEHSGQQNKYYKNKSGISVNTNFVYLTKQFPKWKESVLKGARGVLLRVIHPLKFVFIIIIRSFEKLFYIYHKLISLADYQDFWPFNVEISSLAIRYLSWFKKKIVAINVKAQVCTVRWRNGVFGHFENAQ